MCKSVYDLLENALTEDFHDLEFYRFAFQEAVRTGKTTWKSEDV